MTSPTHPTHKDIPNLLTVTLGIPIMLLSSFTTTFTLFSSPTPLTCLFVTFSFSFFMLRTVRVVYMFGREDHEKERLKMKADHRKCLRLTEMEMAWAREKAREERAKEEREREGRMGPSL
ncbi:hypothetical protein DL98DRAFT_591162 [Cadophora sp. DSE1049]|nr:hypothetical protein DL98DRAFT_591162 [Cadophora sp. DSE1049]